MFGMARKRPEQGQLADALLDVVGAIEAYTKQRKTEFDWFKSHIDLATKQDLKEMEKRIMSVISEFAAKQNAFNTRQGAAIDKAVAAVQGIIADIKTLNDKITELQNSSGEVTPEDLALINDLETQGDALATKAEAVGTALEALDAQTPPTPPVP